jgi:hypothetical protein
MTVTAPAANSTISGAITLGATATAASGLSIANVQYYVDTANFGLPVTAAGDPLALDTTTQTNGSHTISAIAIDNKRRHPMRGKLGSKRGGSFPGFQLLDPAAQPVLDVCQLRE